MAQPSSTPRPSVLGSLWESAGMLVVLAVLATICSVFVDGFASQVNFNGLLLSVSTIGIIACTMLFCLAAGDFDLSVGSTVACVGVCTAMVMNATGSMFLGIASGLALGAAVGFFNGLVIARGGINALIATLATMQIVRGLGGAISDYKTIGIRDPAFYLLGSTYWLHIAVPVWICLACFAFYGWLIEKTTFGRNTLAIGGNAEAARLAGIEVKRVKIIIFTLQGLMAAVAGVVLASRMTSGQPNASIGLELQVISACVLGGVSLSGGIGRMSQVIAGVLIMGILSNAMSLLNIRPSYQLIISGVILLAAVALDRIKQRGRR